MNEFEKVWAKWHPRSFPVSNMMLGVEANWLRFHSLPHSKRYADTEDERQILISRQNQIADEVLGVECPCWLIQSCWETPEGMHELSNEDEQFSACRDYNLSWAFRFQYDPNDEGDWWNVFANLTVWKTGTFNDLFLARADDRVAPVLWMSASTGSVFAPYDGGIDLFLHDQSFVQHLSRKHSEWLSKHPHGL